MPLVTWYRHWRRTRWLHQHPPDLQRWQRLIETLPLLQYLSPKQQNQLAQLSELFIWEKHWYAMEALELDRDAQRCIAAQACLPILALGLEWYRDWHSVVIYPAGFIVPQSYIDEAGVLHWDQELRVGEAWLRGPMVLSWEDIQVGYGSGAYNVIIHECSHKLDMLSGAINGQPPLHKEMSLHRWSQILGESFTTLREELAQGREGFLDAYAAEAPEEFFAVASEAFFGTPQTLYERQPKLYQELATFYRQDPLGRRH